MREGATLGGRVLSTKLSHILDDKIKGKLFFTGTSSDTPNWRSCCEHIDAIVETDHINAMILTAVKTFELFENWINGLQSSTLTH